MSYKKLLSKKEYDRMTEEYDKVKYRCSCGHRVIIPYWTEKSLCHWCHNYVYRDKKLEFRERIKEKLKNG